MIDIIQSFDANALLNIQNFLRVPIFNDIMVFFSLIGNSGLIWISLGLVLLIPKQTRRGGVDLLICLLLAYIINDLIIKELVERARPYETIEGLNILVKPLSSFSFPSGHANSSFAAALSLTLAFSKRGAWAYLPAALIAFSRCYVGVHYPSDVLAGMLVGTLVALVGYKILHRYIKTDFIKKPKPE
ncbi:MAG: phosphatase PAP2 family protein [Oscillospiraceae bacterium]|nr:phosphatase PAP2 family protein [Oscillospiraceae bacterium]